MLSGGWFRGHCGILAGEGGHGGLSQSGCHDEEDGAGQLWGTGWVEKEVILGARGVPDSLRRWPCAHVEFGFLWDTKADMSVGQKDDTTGQLELGPEMAIVNFTNPYCA